MTDNSLRLKFDDTTPLPDTAEGCRAEISYLADMMMQIDVQFAAHKAGSFKEDDPSWHPKALAAKGHIVRRRRKVKNHLRDLLPEPRVATAEDREHKAQRAAENEANRLKNLAKYKRWYHALHDWAWDNHPEIREELRRFTGELRRGEQDEAEP